MQSNDQFEIADSELAFRHGVSPSARKNPCASPRQAGRPHYWSLIPPGNDGQVKSVLYNPRPYLLQFDTLIAILMFCIPEKKVLLPVLAAPPVDKFPRTNLIRPDANPKKLWPTSKKLLDKPALPEAG
jgi:hypothetical protein